MGRRVRIHQEVWMSSESTITLESHRSAAALYASGALTAEGVLRAMAQVAQLPSHVRALCVDLRAVRVIDDAGLRALDAALREWRAARRGMSRVRLRSKLVQRPSSWAARTHAVTRYFFRSRKPGAG
jgi:ABC-type transporter Mla MlaB component